MTPERQKEFEVYVEALRAVFESPDDRHPIRVAITRKGEEKAVAFAIVVAPDDLTENARMMLVSGILQNLFPPKPIGILPVRGLEGP